MRHPPAPPQLAVGEDPETDLLLQADRRGHRRRPPAAPVAIVTAVEAVVDCGDPASVLAMVCRLLDGTPRR
jgi:hypothetical protein